MPKSIRYYYHIDSNPPFYYRMAIIPAFSAQGSLNLNRALNVSAS